MRAMYPITRTSLIATALTGAALVSSAPAQATTTTLSPEQAATRVAAWESTIMWSRLDPTTGRYVLMKSVGGTPPTALRNVRRRPRDEPVRVDDRRLHP